MFCRSLNACCTLFFIATLIIFLSGCESEEVKNSQEIKEITLNPSEGRPGTEVEIQGYSFGSSLQSNMVKFGDEQASVTSINYNSAGIDILKVVVPVQATTGKVTIQAGGTIFEGPVFTVIRHEVHSISPTEGYEGQTVVIKGAYFDKELSKNTVFLNGVSLSITKASETELEVIIPQGASTGNITVEVSGVKEIAGQFVVKQAAQIAYVSLNGGEVGTRLTVTGNYFNPDPAENLVTINGVPANVLEIAAANNGSLSMLVMIPEGASTGKLIVRANDQEVVWPHDIVIPEELPWINTLSLFPGELLPGFRFMIQGRGFSPEPSFNKVSIGKVQLTVLRSYGISLVLEVPKDIDFEGNISIQDKIVVTVNNKTYIPSDYGRMYVYSKPIVMLDAGSKNGKVGDEVKINALVLPAYDADAVKVFFTGINNRYA